MLTVPEGYRKVTVVVRRDVWEAFKAVTKKYRISAAKMIEILMRTHVRMDEHGMRQLGEEIVKDMVRASHDLTDAEKAILLDDADN